MNTLKITFLMALLTVAFVLIGGMVGGKTGAFFALLLAGGMNFFSYWNSDKMVLKMYGAKEVTEAEAPELHAMARRVAQRAEVPMPRLYIIETDMANAFATGRNPENSAVAVTTGIMRILSRDELEGVVAHEIGHIKNRDILISTIAATMAGAITFLAQMGQWSLLFGGRDDEDGNPLLAILALILMPIAAMLIQMAISRSREYSADAAAAQYTGNPMSLAGALQRLERAAETRPAAVNPATSHLFIVNPLRGASLANLFSTHPPIAERVARLQDMAFRR